MSVELRAFAPLLLLAVALVAYCLWDLARADAVRHLPRWAWALICVATVPLGPIAYLFFGRLQR